MWPTAPSLLLEAAGKPERLRPAPPPIPPVQRFPSGVNLDIDAVIRDALYTSRREQLQAARRARKQSKKET